MTVPEILQPTVISRVRVPGHITIKFKPPLSAEMLSKVPLPLKNEISDKDREESHLEIEHTEVIVKRFSAEELIFDSVALRKVSAESTPDYMERIGRMVGDCTIRKYSRSG